jgi:hypothetical protein
MDFTRNHVRFTSRNAEWFIQTIFTARNSLISLGLGMSDRPHEDDSRAFAFAGGSDRFR